MSKQKPKTKRNTFLLVTSSVWCYVYPSRASWTLTLAVSSSRLGEEWGEFGEYSVSATSWVHCWKDNNVHGSLRVHMESYSLGGGCGVLFVFIIACFLLILYFGNCTIPSSTPKLLKGCSLLHIGYVHLSGLYLTWYFQRWSNTHLTSRQLLKQGKSNQGHNKPRQVLRPCTVNTRYFFKNGAKIIFINLPNKWWKGSQ